MYGIVTRMNSDAYINMNYGIVAYRLLMMSLSGHVFECILDELVLAGAKLLGLYS